MKVIIIRKFTTNKILCIYLQSSIFKKLHVGWSCFHNFSVLLAFKSINMTHISGNAWLFWLLTDRYLAEVKTLRTLKLCLFFKLHLTYFVKWDKIQWVTFICIIQPNTLMSTWRIDQLRHSPAKPLNVTKILSASISLCINRNNNSASPTGFSKS